MDANKTWDGLTEIERKEFLFKWFNIYSTQEIKEEDIEKIKLLISEREKDIINYIITTYICEDNAKADSLIEYIRNNKVEELFNSSIDIDKTTGIKNITFKEIRRIIMNEIIRSINNPLSPMPLLQDKISLDKIVNDTKVVIKYKK